MSRVIRLPPERLTAWTGGRALIGTGSPFPPVTWNGRTVAIDQTNNAYIFPGVGLGVLASGARRVNDAMFMAAAKALAALSPTTKDKNGRLLPPVTELCGVLCRCRSGRCTTGTSGWPGTEMR